MSAETKEPTAVTIVREHVREFRRDGFDSTVICGSIRQYNILSARSVRVSELLDAYDALAAELARVRGELVDASKALGKERTERERLAGIVAKVEADSARLDWLQSVMTPADAYCEVFFAGLRYTPGHEASAFQIESNPALFPTINRPTVREVIDATMQALTTPPRADAPEATT